jgi:hypothetical protein
MKKFDLPPPAKLVCGILYPETEWLQKALVDLQAAFGDIDFQSDPIDFTFTDYYFREMGSPLLRVFVAFARLIDPAQLSIVKVRTNTIEQKHARPGEGGRVLNLDPGTLNATAFILATSKNYAHRIYLSHGVFAQQELLFEKKGVQTLDWTYPDYRSARYHEVFLKLRNLYLEQLRSISPAKGELSDGSCV